MPRQAAVALSSANRRLLHRSRSIRWRLIALNLALVAVVLVSLSAGQYVLLRRVLIGRTDALVRGEAQPAIGRLVNGPQQGADLNAQGKGPGGTTAAARLANDLSSTSSSAAVVDTSGRLLARTDPNAVADAPPLVSVDPARVRRALAGATNLHEETTVAGQHLLVVLLPLRPQHGSILGVAAVATPLASVDGTLRRLALIDLAGVGAALLLVLLISGGIAAVVLAPLRRMIGTAERLGEGDLSQRVLLDHSADEVGQLADAIDHMAERLEALFAAQRQFVADASHELRTPLTIVRGSLDLLLMQAEEDPQQMLQMLRTAQRELLRMSRLVVDLLELARIDAGLHLTLAPVDLNAIAEAAISDAREVDGDAHRLALKPAGDAAPYVEADALRVAQIVRNFLDNARIATPDGGFIAARVGVTESEGWLEVQDSGPGIAPEHQALIFDRFYRVDAARSRNRGGAGLGLAIARSLAEAQLGRIELRSSVGNGACFRLVLPRTMAEPHP